MNFSRTFFRTAQLAVVFCILLFSCKNDGPHQDDIVRFSAKLSGNSEPQVETEATGEGVLEFRKSTGELSYNLSLRNIHPSQVVIAYGNPDRWNTGPALFDITSKITEKGGSGIVSVGADHRFHLLNDYFYFLVKTEAHPFGELRGQIEFDREK